MPIGMIGGDYKNLFLSLAIKFGPTIRETLLRCNKYKDLPGFHNLTDLRQRKWKRPCFPLQYSDLRIVPPEFQYRRSRLNSRFHRYDEPSRYPQNFIDKSIILINSQTAFYFCKTRFNSRFTSFLRHRLRKRPVCSKKPVWLRTRPLRSHMIRSSTSFNCVYERREND